MPRKVVIDSGPLFALFNRSDRYHQASIDFLKRERWQLITNIAVITEVTYLLDFSTAAQQDFLEWARRALKIDKETGTDLPAIQAIIGKYADLPADFADASLVALCNRLDIRNVASVDKDFTIYRNAGNQPFENLLFS